MISRGLGNDGSNFQEVNYEGYGPSGIAIFVETSTDNVTRTVANMRFYFSRNGGQLGNTGSLQFLFEQKAVFEVLSQGLDSDDFELEMMDANVEEIEIESDRFVLYAEKEDFGLVQEKLEEMGITPEEASLERIPTNKKVVDEETFEQVMKLIDVIEDDTDVVSVYHNIDAD